MHYKCQNCQKDFDFGDSIEFCPYCGSALSSPYFHKPKKELEVVRISDTIDTIWGNAAKMKRAFSDVITNCMYLIDDYSDSLCKGLLPNEDLTKYDDFYNEIKQSGNRKALLVKMEKYLEKLGRVINQLEDTLPADLPKKLEENGQKINCLRHDLYGFLGLPYKTIIVDFAAKENFTQETLYTKEQITALYDLVLEAYSKYKRCVEDNNMFAAFASTSNYGMLPDYWKRWFASLPEDDEEEEDPDYHQVVKCLRMQNSQKYYGLLDEDFVPHVDAFWYGLEKLCEFIDRHIDVDINLECMSFGLDEREKILRLITNNDYFVDEERLEESIDYKKTLSETIEKLSQETID